MVMSRDQNAGENYDMKIGDKSFVGVEQFKYLGITLSIKIPFMMKLRAD
jgi:hypothetical protein